MSEIEKMYENVSVEKDWTCRSTIQNRKGCYCCKDITDCLLKRIVELCNDVLEQETDPLNSFEMSFAQKILQLLEIEECE